MKKVENTKTLKYLFRLWKHLSRRRKQHFYLYASLILISGFLEIISLGAVLPFVGIILAPNEMLEQPRILNLATRFGINSADEIALTITIIFIFVTFLAIGIRLLSMWIGIKLANACGLDISLDIFSRFLYKPYQAQLTINSSTVLASISKVNGSITVLYQFFTLINSSILLVSILAVLLSVNFFITTVALSLFCALYLILSLINHKKLIENSKQIAYQQTQLIKAVQESLGGIRDLLLNWNQNFYCKNFYKSDYSMRKSLASNAFISNYPRLVVEGIGILSISIFAYVLTREDSGITTILPMLGVMVLGAQRMLPALQLIYSSWVGMAGTYESLVDIVDILDAPQSLTTNIQKYEPLIFKNTIHFKNVSFRYKNNETLVLNNVNFIIKKGSKVGLIGKSGGGKSTLVDLLMGLLVPTEGDILVDNQKIEDNEIRRWQQCITHVPQNIYLADTTIAENIAFGIDADSIDFEKVRQSARLANIAEYIENSPDGYNSKIGERGIMLSGGQRQRIGIARALYKNASVLILDEATSALDNNTEELVMESIKTLGDEITTIIIAHRLTTIRDCNVIFNIDRGKIYIYSSCDEFMEKINFVDKFN